MKIAEQELCGDSELATLSELSRRSSHVAECSLYALKQTLSYTHLIGPFITQSGHSFAE